MAKPTKTSKTTKAQQTEAVETNQTQAGLPVPFGREAFQQDVTDVFLYYVRNIAMMVSREVAWPILGLPAEAELENDLYTAYSASDIDLTFEHIKDTNFAKSLVQMYDYAYFGRLDRSAESFEDESIHSWVAGLVYDAKEATIAEYWNAYGGDTVAAAKRCSLVAETANARSVLEGSSPFFVSFQRNGKDAEGFLEEDLLTVRQLALLSGMEETSIRASANPNRPNPLPLTKTENGTRLHIDAAKEWLIAKGRYVPITQMWSGSEVNLAKLRFDSYAILDSTVQTRYRVFCHEDGREDLDAQCAAVGIQTGTGMAGPILNLTIEQYQDEATLRGLAQVLDLPAKLLVLRAKEAFANEALRLIESDLKQATKESK